MSLLVFMHHPAEGPAVLGQMLQAQGHRLRPVRLFEGQAVPADLDDVSGVISMGGPMNVDQAGELPWMRAEMDYLRKAHEAGKPIVGICLGAQLIAAALGGQVAAMAAPEVGFLPIRQAFPGTIDPLHAGIPWNSVQFHLHGQEVTKLPPDGVPLSGSKACRTQAFKVGLTTYAFQYHFEWQLQDIQQVVGDGLVAKAGSTPEAILKQAEEHFAGYRRLGDRLAENLAGLLFPIDKI